MFLGHGGHSGNAEVGPLQKHGERAQIVNVAADVRIEMDFRLNA